MSVLKKEVDKSHHFYVRFSLQDYAGDMNKHSSKNTKFNFTEDLVLSPTAQHFISKEHIDANCNMSHCKTKMWFQDKRTEK